MDTALFTLPDGQQVAYLKRRFLPSADRFSTISVHTVTQGERLDQIANTELGDPLLFWRLCDANNAMHPRELEETGLNLRITLPEGLPAQGR